MQQQEQRSRPALSVAQQEEPLLKKILTHTSFGDHVSEVCWRAPGGVGTSALRCAALRCAALCSALMPAYLPSLHPSPALPPSPLPPPTHTHLRRSPSRGQWC